MIQIERSSHFNRQYKKFVKNNLPNAKLFLKVIGLFRKNSHHPSLNCEKLLGNNVWSLRIDQRNRIFFIWKSKTSVIFIDIGKHDKYRKY